MKERWLGSHDRASCLKMILATLLVFVLCCSVVSGQTDSNRNLPPKLPREIRIVTITSEGLQGATETQRVDAMLQRMNNAAKQVPDLICLPELFAQIQVTDSKESVRKSAEDSNSKVITPIAKFAKANQCFVVCPAYRIAEGKVYNSAYVLDRNGAIVGHYDKIHTTLSEMELGVAPGATDQDVIVTELGRIGIQICYDIEWHDGWDRLREQRAEIIVWPSAFSGGKMVMAKAWENRCNVISSTGAGPSRICECSGDVLAATSRWNTYAVATVNLERAFLHTWPSVQQFPAIEAKYGNSIRLQTFAEEEWSLMESRSPDLKVMELLKEFGLETRDDQLKRANDLQMERR